MVRNSHRFLNLILILVIRSGIVRSIDQYRLMNRRICTDYPESILFFHSCYTSVRVRGIRYQRDSRPEGLALTRLRFARLYRDREPAERRRTVRISSLAPAGGCCSRYPRTRRPEQLSPLGEHRFAIHLRLVPAIAVLHSTPAHQGCRNQICGRAGNCWCL